MYNIIWIMLYMKGSVVAECGQYHDYAYAGGICGSGGNISNSYNNASIEANNTSSKGGSFYEKDAYASGISNVTTVVNDCYNAGDVRASSNDHARTYASGISCRYPGYTSKVTNCYNIGKIQIIRNSGTSQRISEGYGIGDGTNTHSYYLTGTGQNTAGATELTEKQAQTPSLYASFDFENVWVINEYANYPYPQLKNNIQDMSEAVKLVSIISLPAKTEYYIGDKLDFTGAMVKVVYTSGREEIIKITDEIVSGFDMNTVGEQQVTVTIAGASDTYTIHVIERPAVKLITILMPPEKTVFAVGTSFDFAGAKALITYKNGTIETVDITFDMTTGGDIDHIGKQTITYTFGGQSVSFEVEVVGIELSKIVLTQLPNKLSYLEGNELDLSGMVVTAVMNNGIESTVDTGYTVSGYSSEPGNHTITITYMGKTACFEVTVAKKQLVSLMLNALPDKLEYVSGQEFDKSGMQIIANYDNGDAVVTEEYEISGFDDVPGIKNIVISLDGKSISFPVRVTARIITDFKLVSLPSKLVYIEYEPFDPTGLRAEVTYNDGLTEAVTDYTILGFSSEIGTHTLAVSYEGFVKSFEISVTPRTLDDIKVIAPDKIIYNIGEEFDATGMRVVACYNNGQELTVDDYRISGFDSSSAGIKTITVTYSGISRSFAVTVRERSGIKTGGNMIVGNIIGRLADKVVVPVSVTNNTGIAGFTHTIRFDATVLKLVSVDAVNEYADGTVVLNDEKIVDGEFTVLWFGGADVNGDGAVYNLTFEVLETAPDGNSEIIIDFADNNNGNISGENVIFRKINGSVEVRSYWLGDLNGDREYHMADLLLLAQYVSGKEMNLTEKQLLSADVNEDGIIDIHDVIMLQQWIIAAGIPEE